MAKAEKSDAKPKTKPKLTDAERHRRFLETARAAKASDEPEDFDRAFAAVAVKKSAQQ